MPDEDLTRYDCVPATTVRRALEDVRDRMPPDRWQAFVVQALRRELIGVQDIDTRGGFIRKPLTRTRRTRDQRWIKTTHT